MAENRGLMLDSDFEINVLHGRARSSRMRKGSVTTSKRMLALTVGFVVLGLACVGLLKSGHSSANLRSGNVHHATELEIVEDVTDANKCDHYPYLKFQRLLHNNLMNKGPDDGAEGLTYRVLKLGGGTEYWGKELNLHVHATSTAYVPFASKLNGMQGKYGSINLKSGTEVDLEISFSDPENGNPITLPNAALTFFDLDTGHNGKSMESFTTSGFSRYFVMRDSEVKKLNNGDGSTSFHASTYGNGEDNPLDPMFLTAQQKNRAVSLLFKNTTMIKVNLKSGAGQGPRFFTFVGRPSLLCAVTVQAGAPPPLIDLDYKAPWEVPVEAEPHMIFVRWVTEVGKEVETGDPLCVVKDKDGVEHTYHAPTDGSVKALQEGLKPGEEIDMRLSDKTLAVIEKPALPELSTRPPTPLGRVMDEPLDVQPGMFFVKWHVGKMDHVQKGDPICDVEDEDGTRHTLTAQRNGYVMSYQEHLEPEDPLDEALQAGDMAVIGLLPKIECDPKIGEAPTTADDGAVFHMWDAKVGEVVEKGDPIAKVKLADGTIKQLTASKSGIVVHRQDELMPGMVVDETIEDNNLATLGKCPPLKPTAFDVGVFAGPNMIFKEWKVEVGDVVQEGDELAVVKKENGEEVTIYAPREGTVVARQDYLKPGWPIDMTIMDDDLVVIGKFPELTAGMMEQGVNPNTPNVLPEGTKMTPEEWNDAIFVKWYVDMEEPVDHNSPIAQIAWGGGEGKEPGSEAAADKIKSTVPLVAEPEMIFVRWETDVGKEVKKDDPLCVVRDKDGVEKTLTAPKDGWVMSKSKLAPGDIIDEQIGEDPLALIAQPSPKLATRPPADDGTVLDHPMEAPKGMRFVKWLVGKGDHVSKGDPICVVEDEVGEQETLTAPEAGFVMSYQEQLEPHDPLDVALEAQDMAVIGLLPKIPCDTDKEQVPTPADKTAIFQSWEVDLFETVAEGDAIAKVKTSDGEVITLFADKAGIVVARQDGLHSGMVIGETIEDDNLATIGDKSAVEAAVVPPGFQKLNITAPGWGKVVKKNPLVPGQKLGDMQYGSNIVVLDSGYPWWLLLLCACLLLCCCCFPCLYYVMAKPKPVVAELVPFVAPVVAPPPPVVAPPPVVPPPPVVVPPVVPPGTRLDFADPAGIIHSYYALYRPLGIKHNNIAPIIAHDFTLNSYAKIGLGVEEGYKLVKVGGHDLTGEKETDFTWVADQIEEELKQWPIWPLPLTFNEASDGSGIEHKVDFSRKPIGLQFSNQAPIRVDKIYDDSPASEAQMPTGWYITKIGEQDVTQVKDFKELRTQLGEGVKPLDNTNKQYDTNNKSITAMFSNQDGSHPNDNMNR